MILEQERTPFISFSRCLAGILSIEVWPAPGMEPEGAGNVVESSRTIRGVVETQG
jgi:hypothetical protein